MASVFLNDSRVTLIVRDEDVMRMRPRCDEIESLDLRVYKANMYPQSDTMNI